MRRSDYCATFDLWQTLIFDKPEEDQTRDRMRCEGLRKVLSGLGLEFSVDDLQGALEESASKFQAIWRQNRDLSTIDQVRVIVEIAAGKTIDLTRNPRVVEMLRSAYIEPFFAFPPQVNEDVFVTLKGMQERVSKIGLISNTGRTPGFALRRFLDNLGILKFFGATIFSDEAGSRKPDKRIFDQALRELGAEPGNTIHIGDNPEADVWGSKQAGMHAVLLDYPVPEEFKRQPGSLFALSRADRRVPDSEINPDARITSLKDVLGFLDSLL